MDKPTMEEIEALLECANVVGGNFARLAAAYRAKCEECDNLAKRMELYDRADEHISTICERYRLRAEMLERQYNELLHTWVNNPDNACITIAKRHAAEREGK